MFASKTPVSPPPILVYIDKTWKSNKYQTTLRQKLAYLLLQLAELARAHINVAPGEEATVGFFWLKIW